MNKNSKNAGIIVIGNEILSGRTQDLNISYIGKRLEELGIILSEVTIIPDIETEIIKMARGFLIHFVHLFCTLLYL